uniref:Leucine-rich repeat-containing protein 20 n=1 Tax=Caenorhabditis japonica TaxID=281687 RepID=A0A2Q4T2J7_CAEJA
MSIVLAAGRGVTQVVERCEAAKESGFLDLSSCQLMYMADAVYMLIKEHEITRVSIQDNAMKKFPKKFVIKFPTATILNMANNEIEEIPDEVGSWKSLKGINGAKNKISKFPDAIFNLENLIYLDLNGNLIEDVDVEKLYTSLPGLVKINLSENPLKDEVKERLKNQKPVKLDLIV